MSKKRLFIIIGAVVFVVAVVIGIILINNSPKKVNKKMSLAMEKLGANFFENYYYPIQKDTVDDIKEYMSKLESSGLKINLTNLYNIEALDKNLVNEAKVLTDKFECDYDKTRISIFPKNPYGIKDYDIDLDLECSKLKK